MAISQDGVIYHKDITDALSKTVGYGTGKKISDFPSGTPTENDRILIEQGGAGKSSTIENLGKTIGINMDLLWTNNSPQSEFTEQTVSLNLSKYKLIVISVLVRDEIKVFNFSKIGNTLQIDASINVHYGGSEPEGAIYYLACRYATISDSGILFSNSYMKANTGVSGTRYNANSFLIPQEIYGVK